MRSAAGTSLALQDNKDLRECKQDQHSKSLKSGSKGRCIASKIFGSWCPLQQGPLRPQEGVLAHVSPPILGQLHDGSHMRCRGDNGGGDCGLKDARQLLPQRKLHQQAYIGSLADIRGCALASSSAISRWCSGNSMSQSFMVLDPFLQSNSLGWRYRTVA